MDYVVHYSDGSKGYLAHYGVKGMKWGVWNDETKNKYGVSGYTMKKGSNIRRFTSEHEAKNGTDMSKRFYAINNQKDYDEYSKQIDNLPGTYVKYKRSKIKELLTPYDPYVVANKKIGLVTYEAIDDVHVAKGKAVLDKIIKDYGDTSVSAIYDDRGDAYVRDSLGIKENDTVKDVLSSKTLSDESKTLTARQLVQDVMSRTDDDSRNFYKFNGKWKEVKAPGKKVLDYFKDQGYDAIEDIEDQLLIADNFRPDHPLIVVNGNKFKIADTKIMNRKKFK